MSEMNMVTILMIIVIINDLIQALLCSAMAGRAPVVPARFPSVNYTS